MYEPVKTAVVATLVFIIFLAGWYINGSRWEAKYNKLLTEHKEAIVQAEKGARVKEQNLQTAMDKERKTKDAKIQAINTKLSTALSELHKRHPRPASVSKDTRDNSSTERATGAELYREDAEFLTREAARADALVEELRSCYRAYDNLKVTPEP